VSRWGHPGGSRAFSSSPDPSNAHAMTSNERFWNETDMPSATLIARAEEVIE
jgi:hypothetical protein